MIGRSAVSACSGNISACAFSSAAQFSAKISGKTAVSVAELCAQIWRESASAAAVIAAAVIIVVVFLASADAALIRGQSSGRSALTVVTAVHKGIGKRLAELFLFLTLLSSFFSFLSLGVLLFLSGGLDKRIRQVAFQISESGGQSSCGVRDCTDQRTEGQSGGPSHSLCYADSLAAGPGCGSHSCAFDLVFCGIGKSAEGAALDILSGTSCHYRLPARAVCEDTGEQAVSFFDSDSPCPDHHQFAHGADDRIINQL